jgi:hypothetical protein
MKQSNGFAEEPQARSKFAQIEEEPRQRSLMTSNAAERERKPDTR